MQHKRGNPRRRARKRSRQRLPLMKPLEVARLTLHQTDPITGNEDGLYTLFYEVYRGYTIYSTEQGQCCIHGAGGCLQIGGWYVAFPDSEQARNLIKHFQADGRTPQENMNRYVPPEEYICLNKRKEEQSRRLRLAVGT